MDKLTGLVLLRALFIFSLIDSGWTIKKCKIGKNTFEMYKSVKKTY